MFSIYTVAPTRSPIKMTLTVGKRRRQMPYELSKVAKPGSEAGRSY